MIKLMMMKLQQMELFPRLVIYWLFLNMLWAANWVFFCKINSFIGMIKLMMIKQMELFPRLVIIGLF